MTHESASARSARGICGRAVFVASWGVVCLAVLSYGLVTAQDRPATAPVKPAARPAAVAGPTVPTETARTSAEVRRRQLAQERARRIARDIVTGILDVQLRQLTDNNLQGDDLYREVASMRGNIDTLIDGPMRQVVETLAATVDASPEQSREHLTSVRADARKIVASLMAERQRLRRRLQLAQLTAQVEQLIARETTVQSATLASDPAIGSARERAALSLREDQRDVTSLFLNLVETLFDMRTWGGDFGATAADGLRLMRTMKVGEELDAADAALASSSLSTAARSEAAVIRGLKALLERVENRTDDLASDKEEILRMIQELIQRQEDLKAQTANIDLASPEAEALIDAESALHRDLAPLARTLESFAPATEPLETARAAAYEALSDLFDTNRDAALTKQQEVVDTLTAVADRVEQELGGQTSDKSAAELADQVKALEALKSKLEDAVAKQDTVAPRLAAAPATATKAEASVAEDVKPLAATGDLPPAVTARLAEAETATATAAQTLSETESAAEAAQQNPGTPEAAATQAKRAAAVDRATDAVERSLSEVEAALADATRRQLAVEVGELARAAEALERAAATERTLATKAESLATDPAKMSDVDAAAIQTGQNAVKQAIDKIKEGVSAMKPETAQLIADAQPHVDAATENTNAAQTPDNAKAKDDWTKAGSEAGQAADKLTAAAAQLRAAAGESAQKLTQVADAQLATVNQARDEVDALRTEATGETATDQAANDDAGAEASPRAQDLAASLDTVREARRQQRLAEGKADAANLERLLADANQLGRQQGQSEAEVADLRAGRSDTPLAAIDQESRVAEAARDLAARVPNDLATTLDEAAEAAESAARSLLNNNQRQADAAQARAAEAIAKTVAALALQAEAAAAEPGTAPDATAQRRVADLAQRAEKQAGTKPDVNAALEKAADAARAAAGQIAQAAPPADVTAGQKAVSDGLEDAENALEAAITEEQAATSARTADIGQKADQLAHQSSRIAPDAAAALRRAGETAESPSSAKSPMALSEAANNGDTPADPSATSPSPSSPHAADVVAQADRQHDELDRAAASLTARAQDIARDRDIAATMAQLARDQQVARDAIDAAAGKLASLQTPANSPGTPPVGSDAAANPTGNPPTSDAGSGAAPTAADPTVAAASEGTSPSATPPAGATPAADAMPTPAQVAAARQLRAATRKFADAQRATGEGAASISRQDQVANRPLKEGLEAASNLAPAPLLEPQADPAMPAMSPGGADPASGEPTNGEPSGGEPTSGEPSSTGEPAGTPTGNAPGSGPPTSGATGQAAPANPGSPTATPSGATQAAADSALGTGMVPNAPKATAEQIAGAAVSELAEETLAKAGEVDPFDDDGMPGEGDDVADMMAAAQEGDPTGASEPGMSPAAGSDPSALAAATPQPGKDPATGKTSKQGEPTGGKKKGDGLNEESDKNVDPTLKGRENSDDQGDLSAQDTDVETRKLEGEPWFAKLPPTLREAIRSNSRRTPPRGYEEKLRNYFESP